MSYGLKISELKRLINRTETCLDLSSTLFARGTHSSMIAASETAKEGRKLVSLMTPLVAALERVCRAQEEQNKSLKAAAAVVVYLLCTRPTCFINRH